MVKDTQQETRWNWLFPSDPERLFHRAYQRRVEQLRELVWWRCEATREGLPLPEGMDRLIHGTAQKIREARTKHEKLVVDLKAANCRRDLAWAAAHLEAS